MHVLLTGRWKADGWYSMVGLDVSLDKSIPFLICRYFQFFYRYIAQFVRVDVLHSTAHQTEVSDRPYRSFQDTYSVFFKKY